MAPLSHLCPAQTLSLCVASHIFDMFSQISQMTRKSDKPNTFQRTITHGQLTFQPIYICQNFCVPKPASVYVLVGVCLRLAIINFICVSDYQIPQPSLCSVSHQGNWGRSEIFKSNFASETYHILEISNYENLSGPTISELIS